MSDLIKVSSQPIDPIYSQIHPGDPINLGQVAVQFDHKGMTHREMANATIRFVPDDRLQFVMPFESEPPLLGHEVFLDSGDNVKLLRAARLLHRGLRAVRQAETRLARRDRRSGLEQSVQHSSRANCFGKDAGQLVRLATPPYSPPLPKGSQGGVANADSTQARESSGRSQGWGWGGRLH